MNETRPMNLLRCRLASALVLIAYGAVAADWRVVSTGQDEVVFIDYESVHNDTGPIKATVLRNYSVTQYLGDWYPHKSKMIVYRFDCDAFRLGIEHWASTAIPSGRENAMGGSCEARRPHAKRR